MHRNAIKCYYQFSAYYNIFQRWILINPSIIYRCIKIKCYGKRPVTHPPSTDSHRKKNRTDIQFNQCIWFLILIYKREKSSMLRFLITSGQGGAFAYWFGLVWRWLEKSPLILAGIIIWKEYRNYNFKWMKWFNFSLVLALTKPIDDTDAICMAIATAALFRDRSEIFVLFFVFLFLV